MRRRSELVHLLWPCAFLLLAAGCSKAPESEEPSVPVAPALDAPPLIIEDGFRVLRLSDFEPFSADDETWREEGDVITCSGQPKGYLHSRDTFRNFTLRCSYRFEPAADADEERLSASNTGFMIHINEPHKIWPRSLEVQGKWSEMCSIKSNGGVPDLTIEDDPAAREAARKPVGEWNDVEIISRDGTLESYLNGTRICRSEAGELTEGLIGLQSELFEVQFRNLRIRED